MGIWYIKAYDYKISWLKKIIKPINIIEIDNKKIVELPNEKYAKRLEKKMYEKHNQSIVIAPNLNQEPFKEICNILNGRWLFKFMIPQILDYISETADVELQKQEIAIMTSDNSENTYLLIKQIAQEVKTLNIITPDIDKFKRLEEYLLENLGIVIHTTNNKKRALIKSSIVLNLDYSEDDINRFSISKDSIIVNINKKIIIKSRRFNGINCNYYNITLPSKYEKWIIENKLEGIFDNTVLLESMLYYKKSYDALNKELKNVTINYLIGNNGKIENDEFSKINFNKLLDK